MGDKNYHNQPCFCLPCRVMRVESGDKNKATRGAPQGRPPAKQKKAARSS